MEKLTVLKIGGNVLNKPEVLDQALSDFAALAGPKALAHGGGRLADVLAAKLGIEARMHQGRRITDDAMLEVVTLAYAGLNARIVAGLQARRCQAIGLHGADMDVIKAHKRQGWDIDYGYAGDIDEVKGERIWELLQQGYSPVFSPLTHDRKGQLLNTNADTIGSAVARSLAPFAAVHLVFVFELPGLLSDPQQSDSLIRSLTPGEYQAYKAQGIISGGMIPKMDNAFEALEAGVFRVKLCAPTAFKNHFETDFVGTEIRKS
jgi:acetylglutamate kinase